MWFAIVRGVRRVRSRRAQRRAAESGALAAPPRKPATMADAELDRRFNKAVWLIRNGPKADSSNEKKLLYYSYYKQATEGDVKGPQPWAVQLEARAKWDAWNEVKGTTAEDAKRQYIALLERDNADWVNHPALKDYTG